jgi:hypothetical protein
MKTLFWIAAVHVAGVVVLFGLGILLNKTIHQYAEDYAGLITVFSAAIGTYSFVANLLYHKNRKFHFWVNRLLLTLTRTHTFWQPAFDFDLPEQGAEDRSALLREIIRVIGAGQFGKAKTEERAPNVVAICLDDLLCVVIRVDESQLHVHLDRKLLVPAQLYDLYRQRLARIAEAIQQAAKPAAVRCGITVSFGDGVQNPYYGFFVNRVPPELLHTFQVSFRLDRQSTCRIEAGTDHVSIEGKSLVDLFEGLSQVLSLRAVPSR